MLKVQYLYGEDVDTEKWRTMLYLDVLHLKAHLADERIKHLNKAHYMEKDSVNITECVNAIKFNEMLIKEVTCQKH